MFYLETEDGEELGKKSTLGAIKKLAKEKFDANIMFDGDINLGADSIYIYRSEDDDTFIGRITWDK